MNTTLCIDVKTQCLAHSGCTINAVTCDLTRVCARAEGRRLPPTCVFIYKAQAESRLGSARRLHTPRGPVHPVIWGCDCPWDGRRVSQAGKTQSSSKLGGVVSCLPGLSPIPSPPLQAQAGFLSQSSCVLVVTKTEGGGQETRWCVQGSICGECEAGHRGPLTQSLLCLPPWQLDCILTPAGSSPPTTIAAHLRGPPPSHSRQGCPGWGREEAPGQPFKGGS